MASKKPVTEQERLELARKLDKELDDFIESLPKKKYEDGWPEDKWEEEMEKHPFFMKEPPKPGDDLHPLYEGLQRLKYDPDENSPQELATSYKEDGNFNFKHKNYRLAILSFTEGIKVKCGDSEIESALLNNRSAANYFLKNYRSSLKDSELALKIKPDYIKAQIRVANCSFFLNQYDKCLEYCDAILEKNASNKDVLKLRQDCLVIKKKSERDFRKREATDKKKTQNEEALLKEILNRGVTIDTEGDALSLRHLEVHFPALIHNAVHFDEENNLVWPAVFLYPEYQTTDFICNFPENDVFIDHLSEVFGTFPHWDRERKYTMGNLNVYYENAKIRKIYPMNICLTLKEVLQEKTYLVRGGTPSFIVFSKGSAAEKNFLAAY